MNKANWDDTDDLCQRLLDISSASELDHGNRIIAFMMCLADMLSSLDCRECRALTRKLIDEELPRMLDKATDYASKQPSTSNHVH